MGGDCGAVPRGSKESNGGPATERCTRLAPPMRRIPALVLPFLAACTPAGEGIEPPPDAIYFPTGLALSRDSRHLYVANSDFDLQYNAGTLLSVDMDHIRRLLPRGCTSDADCAATHYCDVPLGPEDPVERSFWCVERGGAYAGHPCGGLGEKQASERVTVPGRCQAVTLSRPPDAGPSLLVDSVEIGAFATDAIVRPAPPGASFAERLFVPVRGESSVNWVDVSPEGKFDCGQASSRACDESHRIGRDPSSNSRALVLPPEPYAIDATPDASAIVVTHQTQGAVSLLRNDWQVGPHLEHVYGGLPAMPIGVRAVPEPAVVTAGYYQLNPGFLVVYATNPRLDLFRYAPDALSTPTRPYLELAGSSPISINSGSYDVRGVAIDDSARSKCEQEVGSSSETCQDQCAEPSVSDPNACVAGCDAARASGLLQCASVPLLVYASSRSPASLLVGRTFPSSPDAPNSDVPRFTDAYPLPTGPSRVQIVHVINASGEVETRVLVVCFESRRIAVFDPLRHAIETYVTTGRGPQAIVEDFAAPSETDEGHALAVVGHFTDSYLGVIELDRRRGRSYGTVVLSLGTAIAPRTSK